MEIGKQYQHGDQEKENLMRCENTLDVFYILDWAGLRRFKFASRVSNLHELTHRFLNSFIRRFAVILSNESKVDEVEAFYYRLWVIFALFRDC